MNIITKFKMAALEVGNEELKEQNKVLKAENERLKKHIEEFNLCGNTVSKESYNEVLNENIFLKKQIQDLECCGNCIHCYEVKYGGLCCNLSDGEKYFPSIEKRNCDKWESAK